MNNIKKQRIDLPLLISIAILSILGTLMIYSAGGAYAYARYNDENYFLKRQIVWLVIGILTMLIASKIPVDFYKKYTLLFYISTIILLMLVLIIGLVGNGAKRWISIGPLTIQPSEIAKITIIMMLSRYFDNYENLALDSKSKKNIFLYGTLFPVLIFLIPILLVMLQKHLSCIIILGLIGLAITVASGVDLKYISVFCTAGICGVFCLAVFTDYTKERIMVWQNPEAYKLTGGWQTLQGLMAIGSGGFFGVGFGNSIMKHCYVSEPANDMIFSILCEELGFIGAFTALLLFAILIFRGLKISFRSKDAFSRLLAFGISAKMAIQVFLNVAVVTNFIPNTGISLPFFSYGGSSLIMIFWEMGILLSISRKASIVK